MSTWSCRARNCPTHGSPGQLCSPGTWECGRKQPPCPGHFRPSDWCSTGTSWHCGSRDCRTHANRLERCGAGVWYCGRVQAPCPGHSSKEDKCTHGHYQVSGLSGRKLALSRNGGDLLDMAIVMLETENMLATYPYGDVYPDKTPKTGDAANFGIFKQNWLMIRSSSPGYAGCGEVDWQKGASLNGNLGLDVQVLHASMRHYGMHRWWGGHRNGGTGLLSPDTLDVRRYREAVLWIRDQLAGNPSYQTDDTRVFVEVPAI